MSKKELRMIDLWIETECINFEIDMILSDYPSKRIKKKVKLMRKHLRTVADNYIETEAYRRLSELLIDLN
tara:strand:- start:1877 stop:2086 length:210 start_codon:yes stop_codon:yes gene_type:complete